MATDRALLKQLPTRDAIAIIAHEIAIERDEARIRELESDIGAATAEAIEILRAMAPATVAILDRARFDRLLAVVEGFAIHIDRQRDDWTLVDAVLAFDALQLADRDPLP